MTADAAHVAAVNAAFREPGAWQRNLATVAVETLTPLIRAQVAAAIREGCLDGQYAEEEPRVCDACESAAEIAEATP